MVRSNPDLYEVHSTLSESGSVVHFDNSARVSKVNVVSHITCTQSGSGDPSPENVRAISGHAGVVLTVNGADRSAAFGQTVYGGAYDWERGVLTVTHRMVTVSPATHLVEGKTYGCIIRLPDARKSASAKENDVILAADRLKITGFNQIYAKSEQFAVAGLFDVAGIAIRTNAEMDNNQEAIRAWLTANPVTVVYKLATPYEVHLNGTVITAIEGENVLMSSTGDTDVVYEVYARREKVKFTYDEREVCLLDLLPQIYHPIYDYQAMCNESSGEVKSLFSRVTNILSDQFIESASKDVISKWEKYLRIIPNGTDTLDERRFRIIAKLNDRPPYTDQYLVNKLNELCGEGYYRISRDYPNYKLLIEISLNSVANTDTVMEIIRAIIPANIELEIRTFRSRHSQVAKFTHDQLAEHTHDWIALSENLE